jgi:predicted lipoprotein
VPRSAPRVTWLALAPALGLALVLATTACGGGPSRSDVVAIVANDVAVPRFQALRDDTAALSDAAASLCAAPTSATVEETRGAWRTARQTWMRSRAIAFGPVMDRRSESFIAWPEVDTARIEETIASRDSVSAEDVREFFAATQRGLGAAEYLLFEGDPTEVATTLGAPLRCQYLSSVLEVVATEADAILATWTEGEDGGPPYVDHLTGEASVSMTTGAAIDEIGSNQVFLLDALADQQLGAALGETGADPDPAALPGGAANREADDLLAAVEGLRNLYLGPSDDALTALVADRSAEADTRVRDALEQAVTSLEILAADPVPLRQLAANRAPEALEAHDALQALELTWNTDVVSLLGITVGFSDADGDTG